MVKVKGIVASILVAVLIICSMPTVAHAQTTSKIGIAKVNCSALRLRDGDSLSSNVLDHAIKDDYVVVLDMVGDWFKVNYNLQEGYMHSDYLTFVNIENVELGYGVVCGDYVNLRSGPSVQYEPISMLKEGDFVYIIGINLGWYKIIHNDIIGYMRSDFVDLTEIPYENYDSENVPLFFRDGKWMVDYIDTSLVNTDRNAHIEEDNDAIDNNDGTQVGDTEIEEPEIEVEEPDVEKETEVEDDNANLEVEEPNTEIENTETEDDVEFDDEVAEDGFDVEDEVVDTEEIMQESAFGNLIVETAKQYLGVPYVWGGSKPSGFDCSGFVYYVFNKTGYQLSRLMSVQYKTGTPVEKDELIPGDIVFFQNTYESGMSHVGIYVGDGQFIHAPSHGLTVSYADLNSDYYTEHYYGARRITN
jgi:cell wall-associated NlpC family hydrolase